MHTPVHPHALLWLGLVWLLGGFLPAYGQFEQTARLEILTPDAFPYALDVIPLRDKGILTFTQARQFSSTLQLARFAEDFAQAWQQNYDLKGRFYVLDTYYDEGRYFHIFTTDNSGLYLSTLSIDVQTGELRILSGRLPFRLQVEDFKVIDDVVLIIGRYRDKSTALYLPSGEVSFQIMPSFFDKFTDFQRIYDDPEGKTAYFVIRNRRTCQIFVQPYSILVGLLPVFNLGEDRDRYLQQIIARKTGDNRRMLLATFSHRCLNLPQGFCVATFEGGKTDKVMFYKFVDFVNYFKYRNERQVDRIQARIAKRQSRGKDYIIRTKSTMQEDLISYQDKLYVITESYVEEYRNNNMGVMYPRDAFRTFDGYRYLHATITAFDLNGRKLWDNTIRIQRLKEYTQRENLRIGFIGDSTVIAYVEQNKIQSKLVHRYRTVGEQNSQRIGDILGDERINLSNSVQLKHWYDDYFLIWGERPYTALGEAGGSGFFVSKIKYTPEKQIVKQH